MTIGSRIKSAREAKGFTLEELARRLGMNRSTLSRYETGAIAGIPSDSIERIADALDVTPAYLMGWEESDADSYDEIHDALDALRRDPELRTLLSASAGLTREDLNMVIAMVRRLRGN